MQSTSLNNEVSLTGSVITKYLNNMLDGFFFKEENKKIIAYALLSEHGECAGVRALLMQIEQIGISIRRSVNLQNYKHACYMLFILQEAVRMGEDGLSRVRDNNWFIE